MLIEANRISTGIQLNNYVGGGYIQSHLSKPPSDSWKQSIQELHRKTTHNLNQGRESKVSISQQKEESKVASFLRQPYEGKSNPNMTILDESVSKSREDMRVHERRP